MFQSSYEDALSRLSCQLPAFTSKRRLVCFHLLADYAEDTSLK